MQVDQFDHLVLTVRDIATTCRFYTDVLGFEPITFGAGRTALAFGTHKINLHVVGHEFEPKAAQPTPGSADLCFIAQGSLDDVCAHLKEQGVALVAGPVPRTGACGPIDSVYIRDPDGNLLEIAVYPASSDSSEDRGKI